MIRLLSWCHSCEVSNKLDKYIQHLIVSENEELEHKMITKANRIIDLKLGLLPAKELIKVTHAFTATFNIKAFALQDEDFIDSVLFRFAMKQLPLREGSMIIKNILICIVFARGHRGV